MHFSPDIRNVGGRRVIAKMINHHYNRLLEIGPTMSHRVSSVPHRSRRPLTRSLDQCTSLANGSPKVRAKVDSDTPSSYQFRDKLSYHKKLKQSSEAESHIKNIENMQRRICEFASPQERKKCSWDPLSKPVMLLRPKEEANRLRLNAGLIKKILKPAKKTAVFSIVSRQSVNNELAVKIGNRILDTITSNRIFKDADIESLFHKERQNNNLLDPLIVEEAFRLVRAQLNK